MSMASGVPVEPKEQTNLLEESIVAPGVIGGTVPGGESISHSLFLIYPFLLGRRGLCTLCTTLACTCIDTLAP